MELQLKIMVPRRSRDSANAAAAASSELATIRGADRINFRGERSRKSRKRSTARKSKGTAFQSFPSRRLHALVQQSARQRRRRSPVNSLLPGHSLTERRERERKRGEKRMKEETEKEEVERVEANERRTARNLAALAARILSSRTTRMTVRGKAE